MEELPDILVIIMVMEGLEVTRSADMVCIMDVIMLLIADMGGTQNSGGSGASSGGSPGTSGIGGAAYSTYGGGGGGGGYYGGGGGYYYGGGGGGSNYYNPTGTSNVINLRGLYFR